MKLNFAENILFVGNSQGERLQCPGKEDDKIACISVREGSFLEPRQYISWRDLRERVGRLSQALREHGVRKSDRIGVVGSNSLDTLTVFLSVTAIGAIFTSSSTDMGTAAILERLTQVKPKFIFMDDWAVYNQRSIDLRGKMAEIVAGMKRIQEFQGIISQARFADAPADISAISQCQTWQCFISAARSSSLQFEQLKFYEPMIIVYSSGTTGPPKCIVHSVGGVILNGHKESTLHRCVTKSSVQLQFTTTGWMMYMSSVQLLLTGSQLVLYDGSPFVPNMQNFFRLVAEEKVTHLGISPKFLQTLQKNSIYPRMVADLSSLQVVTSTGMVLANNLFKWFYREAFPKSVQLCNISGGTDIAGAFGTGNPLLPVYVGGCQCLSLGMAVQTFQLAGEDERGTKGVAVPYGTVGELVCTEAFPTMPVELWGDKTGQKYFHSYFSRCRGSWTHGDLIMIHPQTRQIMFLGRSDGVLNPSGIRFGSSEIYNIIETRFVDTIADSLCVGQRRPQDLDESVMLFILMRQGKTFSRELVSQLQSAIRQELSPRHVPKYFFETPEIPVSQCIVILEAATNGLTLTKVTINGKKVELPVKEIVSGKTIVPSGTLANPQSLKFYYQFANNAILSRALLPKL